MRKHRLAELLLVNVIGMPYEEAHDEACRWEHVMSDAVEQRVYELLDRPTRSPYGNPIPGLDELGQRRQPDAERSEARAQPGVPRPHRPGRGPADLRERADRRRRAPPAPRGRASTRAPRVTVAQERDGVTIDRSGDRIRLPREVASRVFVAAR